jgi:hypothetical protein
MKQEADKWRAATVILVLLTTAIPYDSSAEHNVTLTEDVSSTKHNLVSNPDINAIGTTEVCIFCHTPHAANPTVTGAAPLWNRLLPLDISYTVYTSQHFEAQDAAGNPGRPKGVSLACLSCHDGSIALDALVNAPGSGGLISANSGQGAGPGVSASGISFPNTGIVDSASTLSEGLRNNAETFDTTESPYSGGIHDVVSGSAAEGAQPFPNLGTDLRDDHPVGMEIPCISDPQFEGICQGLSSTKLDGGSDGEDVAFISRTAVLTWPLDKRDRLRAYPSTNRPGEYYIECASCHNPHAPRVSFLRLPSGVPGLVTTNLIPADTTGNPAGKMWAQRPNASSAICLSCHEK